MKNTKFSVRKSEFFSGLRHAKTAKDRELKFATQLDTEYRISPEKKFCKNFCKHGRGWVCTLFANCFSGGKMVIDREKIVLQEI